VGNNIFGSCGARNAIFGIGNATASVDEFIEDNVEFVIEFVEENDEEDDEL
jgi:hypothetical protein